MRHLHEFSPEELGAEVSVGDVVTVAPFEPGQIVRVTGTSKGKGYAGTIKRHHFSSGPKSHGRTTSASRGPSARPPTRAGFKGMRMSGRMGARQVTQRGLQVIDRDPRPQPAAVRGAVPAA